jgi:GntR family transcriptional regulator
VPNFDRRPMYQQVADFYRDLILSGELGPGQMLPSVTGMMTRHQVSRDTAHKAVGLLQVAKLVSTSTRGTYVRLNERNTRSPRERAIPGLLVSPSETVEVTAAGTVPPPVHVVEALDVPPGDLVIRREELTFDRGQPARLTVDWTAACGGHITCAHLLDLQPVEGGTLGCVERATGRTAVHGRDAVEGRAADEREARLLRIPAGTPVHAVVSLFSDADGVLLYREAVVPPGLVSEYTYDLADVPEP